MATREILDLEEMAAKFKTMPKPKTPLEARAYLNRALALQTKIDRLWNRSPKGSEEAEYGEMLADEFEPAFRAAEDIAEKMLGKTASRLRRASGGWKIQPAFNDARDRKSFFDAARKFRVKLTELPARGNASPLFPLVLIEGNEADVRNFLLKEYSNDPDEVNEEMETGKTASRLRRASRKFNIPGKHILDNAQVSDNAQVYNSAQVSDNAKVSGNAQISGYARVGGKAKVLDNAQVYDGEVSGNAKVADRAEVHGNARVTGNATLYGDAIVLNDAIVSGYAFVGGDAKVGGDARIGGTAVILGGRWDGSEGEILSGRWMAPGVPA